jgi:4'-phosphopantetheinyl transferase
MNASPDLQIWQLNLDELDDDRSLLSEAERQRVARFVRSRHGGRYMQAHCALRRIVASAVGSAPDRLDFVTTEAGKPRLSLESCFDFSLSHSGPLALIATSKTRRIGVDIEVRRNIDDLSGVARALMSERELRNFENAKPQDQRRVFFDLWTRKEALLKATGRGFLEDPRSCDLGITHEATSTMFADTSWVVTGLCVASEAAAAIAIENIRYEDVVIDVLTYDLLRFRESGTTQ